jgi:L-malate glycosyltransferase
MTKPTVMFFSTLSAYPFWEGCEKYWFDLVRSDVARTRIEPHIVLARSPETLTRGEQLREAGLKVSYFDHYVTSRPRLALKRIASKLGVLDESYAYWYSLINSKPSHVVFTVAGLQDLTALSYPGELCRKAGVPYSLLIQHAPEHHFFEVKEAAEAVERVLTGAYKVVFVSERNRRSVERSVGAKLPNACMTANGLSADFLDRSAAVAVENPVQVDGCARFLSLARYSMMAKGQHILLEAISDPIWRDRLWELTFVGSADSFLLERLIDYFGLPRERVTVGGQTDRVDEVLSRHDILMMPSLSEGSPFALVEAMACGRPAVGTPVAGIPEIIIEGETGWLSRSTEVADFAEALERAWNSRSRWPEIGSKAHEVASGRYRQQAIFEDFLDEIL